MMRTEPGWGDQGGARGVVIRVEPVCNDQGGARV